MNLLKQTLISLSIMSFVGVASAQEAPPEPPPALVEVDDIKAELVSEQIWVPGTVISRTDSNIASEVSGRLAWVAEVGQVVEQGEVLAKIDDQLLQLELQQHVANIAKWEARVKLLERKQTRFGKMAELNNTSKDQFDEIQSDLEIAKQEVMQAKIDKKQTQYHISQTEVKSPFTSLVVERLQTPGEYTSIGNDLLRIVDTANVEASIKAPLSAVPYIAKDMEVLVKSKSSEKLELIRTIVPVGNARSRMMEVRVALKPGDFPIGSAVRVALPHSEFHEGTTVLRDALVLRKNGTYVFTVTDENVAKQVSVTTGVGVGNRIEVIGDLTQSDLVVVRGAERLREGQKVRFEETTEIARAN